MAGRFLILHMFSTLLGAMWEPFGYHLEPKGSKSEPQSSLSNRSEMIDYSVECLWDQFGTLGDQFGTLWDQFGTLDTTTGPKTPLPSLWLLLILCCGSDCRLCRDHTHPSD